MEFLEINNDDFHFFVSIYIQTFPFYFLLLFVIGTKQFRVRGKLKRGNITYVLLLLFSFHSPSFVTVPNFSIIHFVLSILEFIEIVGYYFSLDNIFYNVICVFETVALHKKAVENLMTGQNIFDTNECRHISTQV